MGDPFIDFTMNKEKKRVLFFGEVDLSINDARKVHFSNLAKAFRDSGFNVKCLLYSPMESDYEWINPEISLKFVLNPLCGNIISRFFKYLLIVPVLFYEIISFRPNIIYMRFSPPSFLYLLFLKVLFCFSYSFKVILGYNSWISEDRRIQGEGILKCRLINKLQVVSARIADYVRVVAPGLKKRLIDEGVNKSKIAVIENETDTEHFRPMNREKVRRELKFEKDKLYVGFIGNISIWQGLDTLIRAVPGIIDEIENVKFLIIGDGEYRQEIERKIEEFGVKDKVILTGSVPYKKAPKYINCFDIGVAPYTFDAGFSPIKVKDYISCGSPVICSEIDSIIYLKDEEVGVLVKPGDVEGFKGAVIELLKSPERREIIEGNARKYAEENFSWRNAVKSIISLLEMK